MPSIRDEITKTFIRFGKRFQEQSAAIPWLREKAQIGQYRVIRKLGSGGMGQVYLALDTRLGRHVALKVLSPQLTTEPAYVNRFKQEARAASALNHPNILTIYDFCEIEGAHVIVSEFVEGITLRAALERQALELSQGLDVIAQVASALAAAHAAGVVHRDLKPTNIMIRPDGYIKVIDFGLAKLAERSGRDASAEPSLTRPGTVVGTVRYMSPEQARGEEVDHRGDLWSLGVVLYEVVAGHPPFEGPTDNHLVVAILDSPPEPLPQNLALPSGLPELLKRALAKHRKVRFQTAQEFLAALEGVHGLGGLSNTIRLRSVGLRRRHGWLWSTLLALAIVALATWAWLSEPWRFRKPDWFEVSQTERLTYDGDVHRAQLSPNGRWLAYTTGPSGSEILHLRTVPAARERTLPPPPSIQTYSGLTFAPDSKTLFFVLRDNREELGTLFSVPVDRFGNVPAAMELRDVDSPVCFSPDRAYLAFLRRQENGAADVASIFVAPVSDVHNARSIVTLRETQISGQLSWSKEGIAGIAFPSRIGQPTQAAIYLFSPDGKLKSQITSHTFRTFLSPVFSASGQSIIVPAPTQGALQARLEQLFLPTGNWHTITSDLAGFDDLSMTTNGDLLSAVRSIARASVWVTEAKQPFAPVRLTSDTDYYSSLAWTNDGKLLLPATRTGSVNLMILDQTGRMQPLLKPQAAFETSPATVAGRDEIVYSSNAARGGGEFNIWKVTPGRSEPLLLTSGSNLEMTPQITPDGKWVIYTSAISGGQTLWKVPLGGGTPQQVSPLRARTPFVSPDGQSVVCEIREPRGDWRVAILSLATGGVVQEIPSIPIGGLVRWSPDGLALDYISHEGGQWLIRRQPLKQGSTELLVGSPEDKILFFAWSRDGTKLAYILGRVETDAVLLHRVTSN